MAGEFRILGAISQGVVICDDSVVKTGREEYDVFGFSRYIRRWVYRDKFDLRAPCGMWGYLDGYT